MRIVTTGGLATLALGLGLIGLATYAANAEGQTSIAPPPYGTSGHWAMPLVSELCEDTQRCAEWHDDTDGEDGPKTICCVETSRLPFDSYRDCLVAFRAEPRDG